MDNGKKLKETFLNIRKSHRLIKEYQERMINLMFYIKEQFSMQEIRGEKHFSNCLSNYKTGNPKIKIDKNMWAWDFIYTWEFEYHFGLDIKRCLGREFTFQIFQISDNGYYKLSRDAANDISTFASVENSDSLLIFVFNSKLPKEKFTCIQQDTELVKDLFISDKNEYYFDNKIFAKSYKIEEFYNQDSTDKILNNFNDSIYEHFKFNIIKKSIV